MRAVAVGGVVVVAVAVARVGADRGELGVRTQAIWSPDVCAAVAIAAMASHALGGARRPLQHAQAAHRRADDERPRVDAEQVGQRGSRRRPGRARSVGGTVLPHGVAVGRRRRRPGGALTAAEHVGCDDEPAVGVDRRARARPSTDHQPAVSGARAPASPVTCESPVSACSTSTALSPSSLSSPHVSYASRTAGQPPARLEVERPEVGELPTAHGVALAPGRARRDRRPVGRRGRAGPEGRGRTGGRAVRSGTRSLQGAPPSRRSPRRGPTGSAASCSCSVRRPSRRGTRRRGQPGCHRCARCRPRGGPDRASRRTAPAPRASAGCAWSTPGG